MEELIRILSDFQRLFHFPANEYKGVRKANIEYHYELGINDELWNPHTDVKISKMGETSISHSLTA